MAIIRHRPLLVAVICAFVFVFNVGIRKVEIWELGKIRHIQWSPSLFHDSSSSMPVMRRRLVRQSSRAVDGNHRRSQKRDFQKDFIHTNELVGMRTETSMVFKNSILRTASDGEDEDADVETEKEGKETRSVVKQSERNETVPDKAEAEVSQAASATESAGPDTKESREFVKKSDRSQASGGNENMEMGDVHSGPAKNMGAKDSDGIKKEPSDRRWEDESTSLRSMCRRVGCTHDELLDYLGPTGTASPASAPTPPPSRVGEGRPVSDNRSQRPSAVSSGVPSATPSIDYNAAPSVSQPSLTVLPSTAPSAMPSVDQSPKTSEPSLTVMPSTAPSAMPSIDQSPKTSEPSLTVVPSTAPSAMPSIDQSPKTSEPSLTVMPSTGPSAIPSLIPSWSSSTSPVVSDVTEKNDLNTIPSAMPSVIQSFVPSGAPSTMPNAMPSPKPSTVGPSIVPSQSPSTSPVATNSDVDGDEEEFRSVSPTQVPSWSSAPTWAPSSEPSVVPTSVKKSSDHLYSLRIESETQAPSSSVQPSIAPSGRPSFVSESSPTVTPVAVTAAPSTVAERDESSLIFLPPPNLAPAGS